MSSYKLRKSIRFHFFILLAIFIVIIGSTFVTVKYTDSGRAGGVFMFGMSIVMIYMVFAGHCFQKIVNEKRRV